MKLAATSVFTVAVTVVAASPHYLSQRQAVNGINTPFPNGQLNCNQFPTGYGAAPIQNAGLGGWIGIQVPEGLGPNGYDYINTLPLGSCPNGDCCAPGAFCSYSCPPGYLKSSWPVAQGTSGQTIGGLHCTQSNKLELASGSIGSTLCVKGTDKVTVKVVNNLIRTQSFCRTDYPGNEIMTIPVTTSPGGSADIATPESSIYYKWNGQPTSSQYYINKGGVSESQACQWGDSTSGTGNWAPLNLGISFSTPDQKAYIGLFANIPTTSAQLDFNIELVAANMNGRCKYVNGQFRTGANYENVSNTGCTVALNSGLLNIVLTER